MTTKMALRSGILVAVLAQGAMLSACGADSVDDPVVGDGDGDAGGDGDGDGDGDAGGDGDGDGDGCEDLAIFRSLSVTVQNAVGEGDEECRVTVAVNFEGSSTELECSAGGIDCYCATSDSLPPSDATVTVSDGETILLQLDDLQEIPNGRGCVGPTFNPIEIDYVEALEEAVSALNASVDSTASAAPCETEADCEALPLGAKACGGPWSYAVVSTGSEIYEETVAQAEELERIERLYNTLAEVTSDCAYTVAPELACESGACVGTSPD